MQVDTQFVCTWVAVQIGVAYLALFPCHAFRFLLVVGIDHFIVVCDGIGDFLFAHA